MVVSRHEFLSMLHKELDPKVYLEIGVQYGSSLVLAEKAQVAYGIDPNPLIFAAPMNQLPNQRIHAMTSDDFFQGRYLTEPIDLAFIDGSHLVEDTFVDWANVQKRMAPGGVIVFDDVLPYNQEIATREQPPGDWTGDVWKSFYMLSEAYESHVIQTEPILVDTWPTGTMVLMGVEPVLSLPPRFYDKQYIRDFFASDMPVPSQIIGRHTAISATDVLERIRRDHLA